MNGKKYKVTIKVVDHPPRCCVDCNKEEQKMPKVDEVFAQTELHGVPIGNKPVYKSSVTAHVSDIRNKSSATEFAKKATSGENVNQKLKTNWTCRDSDVEGSSGRRTLHSKGHSEVDGRLKCNQMQLESERCASLNIYKLQRSNAITHCNEGLDQNGSSLGLDDSGEEYSETLTGIPSKLKTSSLLRLNNSTSNAKYGIWTGKNGFHVDQPVVLRNGSIIEERERKALAMNTNGIGEEIISSDSLAADSPPRRPRLNREGSACSSDSIITEIEGLSDDDHEDEVLCAKAERNETSPNEESSQMTNNNWKKIRSMIHWSPFAKNYKKKYPWVQLAGHQGNFKAGESGTILKKTNDVEKDCLINLMKDVLRPYVPEFKKEVVNHEERYLVMQDLLSGFDSPSVMDCKMGIRTFLEDELEKAGEKPKSRKDLYQKMIDTDPNAPTAEERQAEAITKPRYMKWREELSSSASLGFRIEGIKKSGEKPNKDFKTTRSRESLGEVFKDFINSDVNIRLKYLQRLKAIRGTLESSSFFKIHEVIGSSLLFVHDYRGNVNVWMIDFAKTRRVEDGIELNHRETWQEGNHEDGYLFGIDNMISIWSDI